MWVAFNDQPTVGSANATGYQPATVGSPNSGALQDIAAGANVAASVSITVSGTISGSGTMGRPNAGTPAYNVFNAYVDWTGGTDPGFSLPADGVVTYAFSGLDPNKHYRFTGVAVRGELPGNSSSAGYYSNRWTQAELTGALSYTASHSANVITSNQFPANLTGSQAAWNAGVNNITGDIINWTDIAPASSGTFSVTTTKYSGPFPGGSAADGVYSYGFTAIRLEEFSSGASVAINSPAEGALFPVPTNITIAATVSEFPGTVTNVAFYAGATKLGDDSGGPYDYAWSNMTLGSYALKAVARDDTGVSATSAVVNITVGLVAIPIGVTLTFDSLPAVSDWSTLSLAGDGGTYTTEASLKTVIQTYPASAINQPLGQSGTIPASIKNIARWNSTGHFLQTRPTDNAATLLMATLVNPSPKALSVLEVSYDAGNTGSASEEINGPRCFFSLTGSAGSWTPIQELSTSQTGPLSATLTLGAWPSGSLLYILWADDNGDGMTDGAWTWDNFKAGGPAVKITSPANNALLGLPDNLVINAAVSGFAGTVTNVAFFIDASKLGDDTTGPYSAAWSNATPGQYLLTAVASDNTGVTATSAPVSLRLQMNAAPAVAISSPAEATVLTSPADLPISVSASDADGSVTNVAFFADGLKIGEDASVPYSLSWTNVAVGTYDLTAVAWDNLGAPTTSGVVRLYVIVFTAPTVESFVPAAGQVSNLTRVTVNFTEPVSGVNASDLLVNGLPAVVVAGSNATYVFTFPPPAEGPVLISWNANHDIVDQEVPPRPFSGRAVGEVVQYALADSVPPVVAGISPALGSTIPSLAEIVLTFSEPVGGVQAQDLLINGLPGQSVSGSQSGPYVFRFTQPAANGPVLISWATGHGIHDYSAASNPLQTAGWSYTLDTGAAETNVIFSEIMYHPASENIREEYLELFNKGAQPVNLTGWKITGGIGFEFPALSIPAGGYLVVAADCAVFQAKYPGYPAESGLVGGWTGRLGNGGDELRLRNALGNTVCHVPYANEGDWAIRQSGPYDLGSYGWEWFAAHDGNVINTATGQNEGNRSLELLNPALPLDNGQNWAASGPVGGTPGQANSTSTNNVAPLIYDVAHFPVVPKSTNSVTISARIVDGGPGPVSVSLYFRNAGTLSPPSFSATAMLDDGHGAFAAVLPARPAGTIIEFYVAAANSTGLIRTWPAAARQLDGTFAQTANALYQVDDEDYSRDKPIYRLIATAAELNHFDSQMNNNSDAEMNGTFITMDGNGAKVRYNVGWRNRGAGTRNTSPHNLRINIPTDRKWNNLSEVNLNTQYTHAQAVGAQFSLRSGLPCAAARPVVMRVNGQDRASSGGPQYGCYVNVEPLNGEWAAAHFPDDSGGNVYRASTGSWTANLSYQGTNSVNFRNAGYSKTSNQGDNDWSDLVNLTFALNDTNSPNYAQGVEQNANVRMFMRYLAVCSALDYMETSICRGIGDDYAMYRGLADPRFLLIPHDFDTILGEGDISGSTNRTIFNMLNPPSNSASDIAHFLYTFMRHPQFASVYYDELKRLMDTTFRPEEMTPMIDRCLTNWASSTSIQRMKNFVRGRHAYIVSQIPTHLTISHSLTSNGGYLYTNAANVRLWGRSHAVETRAVRVAGNPVSWSAFDAAWDTTVALSPGLNRVRVQALNAAGAVFDEAMIEIWYDDGTTTDVSGTLSGNATWLAAAGPYKVTGNLTVSAGSTLTIEPGTTIYLNSEVNFTVASGGRMLAEGTPTAPIRFTRAPGSGVRWGGIDIAGTTGSPEIRLRYAHIEFNGGTAIHSTGGTVWLDHLTFGSTDRQYLSLDNSSFVVQDCEFPATTASFEPVHGGGGGIKSGGRGLFLRNFFGAHTGYNDTIDFTGGHRPGPIVHFINNVFMGSGDDNLDLDNTDAWVEGNIFLRVHKNGSPDTSSAVSGGNDTGQASEVTILGNLFYDCDHVAMAKQGDFFTLINNTIVRITHEGGLDTEAAVVCLQDNNMTEGAGIYLEGNIIYAAEGLTQNVTNAIVTFTNNQMQLSWSGPGGNNSPDDPRLQHIPQVSETASFTSWAEAQVLKQWFSLQPGSPALGTGPNGRDRGGVVPLGVSVWGEPEGATSQAEASLTVGINRTGNGIPVSGWPNGSGYTHYKWRLDDGAWSAETPLATPITLTGLNAGAHYVEVVGQRDSSSLWQDDPVLGPDATITRSHTWYVAPALPALRINEILADNQQAVSVNDGFPDLIELYNAGSNPVHLGGMGLTDDDSDPFKYPIPSGIWLNPGSYLVLYGDNDNAPFHTGFGLKQEGEDLFLFAADGQLVDSVSFGLQAADLSIGRGPDGLWALTEPTFGSANQAAVMGDPADLVINEWLASSAGPGDFIELYNANPMPVDLAGLHLAEAPESLQGLHQVAPLSFIQGGGYALFLADGDPGSGPDHLSFKLPAEQGMIGLFDSDLSLIDWVFYGPQTNEVAFGRSPNGSGQFAFLPASTPGAPNPATPPPSGAGQLVINEIMAKNVTGLTNLNGSTTEWIELYNGTTNSLDLAGMSLTDDPAWPQKFIFPAGMNIEAGAHLVVLCEGALLASTNLGPDYLNSGFGIKANGGIVVLYDATVSQIDAVNYGVQARDFSIGRVPDGGSAWELCNPSPGALNSASTLGDVTRLRVNEWMAAPSSGDDWFEIYNPNPQPVALAGLWLSDSLNTPADRMNSLIPPLSFIGTGLFGYERFIADNNTIAGPDHAGFRLAAGGNALALSLPDGTLIDGLPFGLQQSGVSEGRLPDGTANIVRFPLTPTPADANYLPLTNVVINEVLSASPTNSPFEDAIELHNVSGAPVDITGWWLSDSARNLRKFQITKESVLEPGGFVVFYEFQLNANPDEPTSFALDGSQGDTLFLSAVDTEGALTGYRATVSFDGADPLVSFGRHVNSAGQADFVALSERTFGVDNPATVTQFREGPGLVNAYPLAGPVVFSELMYHPPELPGPVDNVRDEFVELYNTGGDPVELYDPEQPANTWRIRGGIDFDFPPGVTMAPTQCLLVVSFDPVNDSNALAGFRATYPQLDAGAVLYGPYLGKLDNGGEGVELRKPGTPEPNFVPYVTVERIAYEDVRPWDATADGTGNALQRLGPLIYGNEPTNWLAGAPTPGARPTFDPDSDGDGIPDWWMEQYFGHPTGQAAELSQATQDRDGDGLTNHDEYLAGTSPTDPTSLLKLEAISGSSNPETQVVLSFQGVDRKSYTIQYAGQLPPSWAPLVSFYPLAATGPVYVTNQVLAGAMPRFYRLVTPRLP